MKHRRILSGLAALLLAASLPMSAMAMDWDIANGDITIVAGDNRQTVSQGTKKDIPDNNPVIIGSSTTNTVSIVAEKDRTANVTLGGVNIDISSKSKAAISTSGEGDVTVELDGNNEIKSGICHAGLEKRNEGSMEITDNDSNGALTAEGGYCGAGIGGGYLESGSNITISGGDILATGGAFAAGIGSGSGDGYSHSINGSNITVSGGNVTAKGGLNGAGLGGGWAGGCSDITVSGDAQVKVQGGAGDCYDGAGAGIGNGGNRIGYGTPKDGAEVTPDTSKLTANGKIEYYAPGADMSKDAPTKTIPQQPSELPTQPVQKAEAPAQPAAPLYRVTDGDGKDVNYEAVWHDGVLTITTEADWAVLTGRLSGIASLQAKGIEKIVFITNGAASEFLTAALLEAGAATDTYTLTHKGETVTFTLGETDVSGILG